MMRSLALLAQESRGKCVLHQVFSGIANMFPLTEAMNVFPIQYMFLNEAA